ncbi:hypothetical protein EKO04_010259 [Ascochyta lentis]|uniref:Uncharacterized protein n=1 Tax=Ascochyta lentis TaxID=205686 RepID=A0A8H7IUD7_9PLEO|nr:hypothetical protein EKO04_010259 [Ascochyta lentis]
MKAITLHSKFLMIPGELRNRIYEVSIAEELAFEENDLPCLVQDSALEDFPACARTEAWTGKRKAYSLTQVCHQIRDEFLALYRQNVKVSIRIDDLERYISEVIQPLNTDPTAVSGNISIIFESSGAINFRDIITLHNRAPHLHLSVPQDRASSDMMSILLNPHLWREFHAYIAEKTEQVQLHIEPDKPSDPRYDDALVFCPGPVGDSDDDDCSWPPEPRYLYPYVQGCVLYVKEEFAEPWMYGSGLRNESYWKKRSEWLSVLGLDKRTRVRYKFRLRVQEKYRELTPALFGAELWGSAW